MGSVGSGEHWALLTGASGFIASHVLDRLLEDGFSVLAGVRSKDKGEKVLGSIHSDLRHRVKYTVVEDITVDGAFDEAMRTQPPLDYVIHTQSPCHDKIEDAVRDMLDPAIKGTTGILESARKYAPTLKRFVLLSSAAAIVNGKDRTKTYDETCWGPMTWEEALQPERAYVASKIYSEKAAWDFVQNKQVAFDLAVINCSWVFGPVQRQTQSLDAVNLTNHHIRDLLTGATKNNLARPETVFTCVDVRDVALSLVRAATLPEASGQRFFIVNSYFSIKRLADILRKAYPELRDRLPPEDMPDNFPDPMYGFDVSKSKKVLGLEYMPLEQTVKDAAQSMLAIQK